jgi:hypothetical protein
MVLFKKDLVQGQRMPNGYGISYIDCTRCSFVCHPVPINIIVHLIRELYHWMIAWHPTKREEAAAKAAFEKAAFEKKNPVGDK